MSGFLYIWRRRRRVPAMEFETLEIPVGDMTFTARAAGPDTGRLVLLLHGFPESSWSWRSQLTALAGAGYRVVAPDQRGYSAGARPEGKEHYAIPHLVADVVAMADWIGGHQFHPVGHDRGGAGGGGRGRREAGGAPPPPVGAAAPPPPPPPLPPA